MICGHNGSYTIACDINGCVSAFGPVMLECGVLTGYQADYLRHKSRLVGWHSKIVYSFERKIIDICPICRDKYANT